MAERTMHEIEELTRDFAEKREALAKEMKTLEDAVARLRDSRRAVIRELVGDLTKSHCRLELAIEDSPSLFKRPKTQVLHGIKIGWRKEQGEVCFSDARQVVKLIRKHLPDQADVLIKTTETPVKSALRRLSVAELGKIGATLTDTSDAVLIKPADSDIDKWIDALFADEESADVPSKAVA